jgi:hypothetical protein
VKRVHPKDRAINPATGKPWVVWFVNNTSSSDGTIKSPFPTLLQAQNASSPNDMIYVFPGDGTTNGMNMGITLQDGQSFFGSGIKQQFATTKGTMTIPVMSGRYPSISNTTDVVTLGNGNSVSGFNMTSTNGAGIITPQSGIINATIANNVITVLSTGNALHSGAALFGSGTFNIYNNQITGPLAGSSGSGVRLNAIGAMMSGVVNDNAISGFLNGILGAGINANPGSYDFIVQGNAIANFNPTAPVGSGIIFTMQGTSSVKIIGNAINNNNNAFCGILINDSIDTQSGIAIITNNTVTTTSTASPTSGIFVSTGNGANTSLSVAVTNNAVNSTSAAAFPTSAAFSFSSTGTSSICLSLDKNIAVNLPTATGFGFTTAGSGVINVDSMAGNIGGSIATSSTAGNGVFFVAPGTCGD